MHQQWFYNRNLIPGNKNRIMNWLDISTLGTEITGLLITVLKMYNSLYHLLTISTQLVVESDSKK